MTVLKKILHIIAMVLFFPIGILWLGLQWAWYGIKKLWGFIKIHKRVWIIGLLCLVIICCGLCGWAQYVRIKVSTQSYYTPVVTETPQVIITDTPASDVTPIPTDTPTPEPTFVPIANQNTFGIGEWTGSGIYDQAGRGSFQMDLHITYANGVKFGGYLEEGSSSVFITGTQTNNGFEFHSTGTRTGDTTAIIIGCRYTGHINQAQISDGQWKCPTNSDLTGTFNLGFIG